MIFDLNESAITGQNKALTNVLITTSGTQFSMLTYEKKEKEKRKIEYIQCSLPLSNVLFVYLKMLN